MASRSGDRPSAKFCPTIAPVVRSSRSAGTCPPATGTALLWRRLGLVDAAGVPTQRGQVVSFFSQGDGLAIAAALEDEHLSDRRIDLRSGQPGCGVSVLRRRKSLGRSSRHGLSSAISACSPFPVIWKMACRPNMARGRNRSSLPFTKIR